MWAAAIVVVNEPDWGDDEVVPPPYNVGQKRVEGQPDDNGQG